MLGVLTRAGVTSLSSAVGTHEHATSNSDRHVVSITARNGAQRSWFELFPDEGLVLTPPSSLVEWNPPRSKKWGHEGSRHGRHDAVRSSQSPVLFEFVIPPFPKIVSSVLCSVPFSIVNG